MLLLEKKCQYHVRTQEPTKGHARIILNCLRRNSKRNSENVQHENAGGKNDTQSSEHNEKRKESETNRNNSNSEDKEDGSEEEGNTDTNGGHHSDNKINPPKNSTTRKLNQYWCGLVYDSNQDVEDHYQT